MSKIRLAIAGVGNCASSLLQGLEYYKNQDSADTAGLMHTVIGGYRLEDIRPVAAFDVDRRKVGKPLEDEPSPQLTEVTDELGIEIVR